MNHYHKSDPPVVHRKVAFLGFRSVGKTSVINSFTTGTFSDAYIPTIETTFTKTIRFRKVHFATDIVDTAGMDEYSRLSRNASLGVHGYALVFSIVSRPSFVQITKVNELLLNTLGDAPDVPRVLVGSMGDLAGPSYYNNQHLPHQQQHVHVQQHVQQQQMQQRQVNYGDAQKLADSWGIPYIECSGRTGDNVAEVFHTLMKEIEKDDGLLAEAGEGGCCIL
mmetsp:Transcript_8769/g.11642  ORF Transcript_8769/g.11642 Transcript_8769/m.11642 type:complete len:222 (+) Transcript_8769:316-981(+)|eukprot:CAMPEP_0198139682 /NCGR_PEP_ID=MMETSP1443-20131203/2954_1 /TAXON_ID=186043 /ORGANISM="Entomoneis sp., Strain CCMP2396" /LENGTH=221 /DNA_ID=CAMNT_0043801883 /DNA_START=261 /DNA_END=926 /DNA_ORIENTATION=-